MGVYIGTNTLQNSFTLSNSSCVTSVLVGLGRHDKIQYIGCLKRQKIFLTVLEPRSPRSGCLHGLVWSGLSSWFVDGRFFTVLSNGEETE